MSELLDGLCIRALLWALCLAATSAPVSAQGPQPGEVYREFTANQLGNQWRVTNPDAANPRARRFLPNPDLHINTSDLEGAVRAEALLDRWGGHTGTIQPRIRFNGQAWLDVPPPRSPPGKGDHPRYYFQDNPVVNVPLAHLHEGDNAFQGTCSHENPTGWGQWGLNALILRVYYEPPRSPPIVAQIVHPSSSATIGENPSIRVTATSASGVARVDVLAWHEGYDENGDGVWLDWHGAHFQPARGAAADLREHVGTAWRSPYELVWDTRWVPDQQPGAIQLIARVQDSHGLWYVTQPISGLSLDRRNESVRLYRTAELPPKFGVRNHATKSCRIPIPSTAALDEAIEAGLHLRTWHGWDGHHEPWKLNELVHAIEGKNHHYDYDVHPIPPSALKHGDNIFTISSQTEEHMLETHWPGPALGVRFRSKD